MVEYRKRLIDQILAQRLAGLPAVMLVGPRATGKTTTAVRHARTVVRMDRPAEAVVFQADPDAALGRDLPEPVLLDEWQMVPEVLGAVKRAVDLDSRPGRFILAGSLHTTLGTPGGWPGVGRVVSLETWPLTVSEQKATATRPLIERIVRGADLRPADPGLDIRDYVDLAVMGGFPEVSLVVPRSERRAWLDGYIDGLLIRDVLGNRNPALFRNFFNAYAANSAGVVTDQKIRESAGINHRTAQAYRQHLLNLMVADELPAWSTNRLKRLARSPKRYLTDSGLLAAALGADSRGVLTHGDLLGRVLETFVVAQIRAEAAAVRGKPVLHHLRSGNGRHEIDLIVEIDAWQVLGIEIKATSAPDRGDARHLMWLRDQLGEGFVGGVVLHTGPWPYVIDDRIIAAPISTLWA